MLCHTEPGDLALADAARAISVLLDQVEDDTIGLDAVRILDDATTVLCALAALRLGVVDPEMATTAYAAIGDTTARLTGIADAITRAWQASIASLAEAMGGVSRSTAQSRREAVLGHDPSDSENWATSGTTPSVAPVCQHAPGYCGRAAAYELVVDGEAGLIFCADHARAHVGMALDRGAETAYLRRYPHEPAPAINII